MVQAADPTIYSPMDHLQSDQKIIKTKQTVKRKHAK